REAPAKAENREPQRGERQSIEKADERGTERTELAGQMTLCRIAQGLGESRKDRDRRPDPAQSFRRQGAPFPSNDACEFKTLDGRAADTLKAEQPEPAIYVRAGFLWPPVRAAFP